MFMVSATDSNNGVTVNTGLSFDKEIYDLLKDTYDFPEVAKTLQPMSIEEYLRIEHLIMLENNTRVQIYLTITNNGDGSVSPNYFLTEKALRSFLDSEESAGYGWSKESINIIETYVGSNVHKLARENG